MGKINSNTTLPLASCHSRAPGNPSKPACLVAKHTFPIADIFHSLQGEGTLAGVPSVLIRLAGCPVRCTWCDTKRAWSTKNHPKRTTDEIVETVNTFDCRHVVITGGEPLIHPYLAKLIDALRRHRYHVTVETAAVVYRSFRCDLLSISPKLDTPNALHPAVIRRLIRHAKNYQLKFVVAKHAHVSQVIATCKKLTFIDRRRVQLMPCASTVIAYLKIAPKVAQWAIENNINFSPRLQLTLATK